MPTKEMTFGKLVDSIQVVHGEMAVNVSLTLRNWIIGYYIKEYEQHGSDRAEYSDKLLISLSRKLKETGLKRVSDRELRRYRTFAIIYPQIWESATPKLQTPAKQLINKLSFTHLAELIKIDNDLKRTFYEFECIKGCWSVRELKRQIASLYYERSGLCGKAALECASLIALLRQTGILRRNLASDMRATRSELWKWNINLFKAASSRRTPNDLTKEAGCLIYS